MLVYAPGTIVSLKEDGKVYFIQEATIEYGDIQYCVQGIKAEGTRGFGSAWHSNDDIQFVRSPTKKDWKRIQRELAFDMDCS